MSIMSYYEERLSQITSDEYQKQAFFSNKSTVVLAGPGSGKTTVLTLKMKRLIDNYISYSRGLACMTFSKEAAREFTERLKRLTSINNSNIFLGTVHSFCLKEIISPFGQIYNKNIPFPIDLISKGEKIKLINRIKKQLNKELKNITTSSVDSLRILDINGISNVTYNIDNDIKMVANEYEKQLEKMKKVDYISLTKYATELVRNNNYIRKCLEAKFPWILVDEYQDLGRPIHEMILCLIKTTNIKFFVVGDLDQSIYSFQGARPEYLKELYDLDEVESIILRNNYRSKKEIVDGSSVVLGINRNYIAKNNSNEKAKYIFYNCTWGLNEQFTTIAKDIIPKCIKDGIKLQEIAILVPKNEQAQKLGKILSSNNIDYYISKHKFERTDFVIWLEKISKWLINKNDSSFEELFAYWECNILKKMDCYQKSTIYYKKKLFKVLNSSNKYKDSIAGWIDFLIRELNIIDDFNSLNKEEEVDNLYILLKEAEEGVLINYGIKEFSTIGKPINQVTVSTRHSSKGLEFDVIILVGMEHNNFPKYSAAFNSDIMEEERRICFVCVSRAKKECYLLNSRKDWVVNDTYPSGKWFNKTPSIFFKDLHSKYGTKENTFYK